MRNSLALFILVFIFFTGSGCAQIQYGVRVSGSSTNISEVHEWSKSRAGFQIAGLALISVTDNYILFFQPEINFSAQGEFNMPYDPSGNQIKQKVFMSYINVPLNMKLYFSDAADEFFAIGGPYVGFVVSKKIDSLPFPNEAEHNEFNTFDFGVSFGLGYSLNRKVEFSARYSYGLSDQVANDYVNKTNSTSIINLGISYFFN